MYTCNFESIPRRSLILGFYKAAVAVASTHPYHDRGCIMDFGKALSFLR